MTKQDAIQKQIDHIMDTFEFGDIIKMMEATEWMYRDVDLNLFSPDETELRQSARKLLQNVCNDPSITTLATGGFHVTYTDGVDFNKPWVRLELMWGIDTFNDGEYYDEE